MNQYMKVWQVHHCFWFELKPEFPPIKGSLKTVESSVRPITSRMLLEDEDAMKVWAVHCWRLVGDVSALIGQKSF